MAPRAILLQGSDFEILLKAVISHISGKFVCEITTSARSPPRYLWEVGGFKTQKRLMTTTGTENLPLSNTKRSKFMEMGCAKSNNLADRDILLRL